MWSIAVELIHPTRSLTACNVGNSRCRRALLMWPPLSTCSWRRCSAPSTDSTAARSASVGGAARVLRSMKSSVSRHCECDWKLVDVHRRGLELGGSALRVGSVDGDDVDGDLVREVERHEHQSGPQTGVDASRCFDR